MRLDRLYAHVEGDDDDRPAMPGPGEDFWFGPVGYGTTGARRMRVSPELAMNVAAVNGCVKVISETLAQLPFDTYERIEKDGRRRATEHPLYRLLHDAPNPDQTSFEFRESMTAHVLLRGNAYAEIRPIGPNVVGELRMLHPDRVEVERLPSGRRRYLVDDGPGHPRRVLVQDDVFHVRGLSFDGFRGVSVIEYAAGCIALSQSMDEYGQNVFEHGAKPSGVLSHPSNLSEDAGKRLGRQLDRDTGGANAGRTMVLEEGMTWSQVGLSSIDVEWLAGKKFSVEDVCRFFRMPPHMIQHLERSTNNNIEHQGLEFVTFTMLPWLKRWEGAVRRDLILNPARFYAEFNLDALLRADTKERFEAYRIGREIGAFTPNDVLRRENMNPRADPGGDEYVTPMNMKGSDEAAGGRDPQPAPAPGLRPVPRPAPKPAPARRAARAAAAARAELFARDAAGRILRREVNEAKRAAVKNAGDSAAWARWVDEFYAEHVDHVVAALHVSEVHALDYAQRQKTALTAGGAAVLETWEADNLERVTALALGRESA